MKRKLFGRLLLALFSYAALSLAAQSHEGTATAEELSMAKINSAIESGIVPKADVLVFVVCTDSGDGSAPVVALDAPQPLTNAQSQRISYVNDEAGSPFKGAFMGSLDTMPGHEEKKRLVGAYSYETGRTSEPAGPKGNWSAQSILTRGTLTKLGGGGGTITDAKTGKSTTSSISVFAYYK